MTMPFPEKERPAFHIVIGKNEIEHVLHSYQCKDLSLYLCMCNRVRREKYLSLVI